MNTTRHISWILAAVFGLVSQLASATIIPYSAVLSGPNESPPNASTGTGSATVTINTGAQTMKVDVSFSGLSGGTTASHIHCCTATPGTGVAGVATQVPTFGGFPTGVTAGTYTHTFDLTAFTTYNPTFELAHGGTPLDAEAALLAGLAAGEAYLNIHTTTFPGGEIRGFLSPAAPQGVPEPASLLLFGVAGVALVWSRRSGRRR